LTFIYGFIWTSVLAGLLFLCETIQATYERTNNSDLLAADWSTLKGFLRIERGKAMWYADLNDPNESATVSRLQRGVIVTDSVGNVLERSPAAANLTRNEIFDTVRQAAARHPISMTVRDGSGKPFLVLCGQLLDESGTQQYYAFIGRPLIGGRLIKNWLLLILPAAALSFALSWSMIRYARKIELPPAVIVS
jgi:hypothetical protein